MLAPLAGIGNWFVRLQAKRYGAGLAVSEMVSSFADPLRQPQDARRAARHPPRRGAGGPVAIQLFGHDPEIMRSAAATVARAGADLIDLNMGCPVPKVMKTGAGAAMLKRPRHRGRRRARRRARAPACPSPSSCARPQAGRDARARASRAGSSRRPAWPASRFHPRSAAVRHKGRPDYDLAARARRGAAGARDRLRRDGRAPTTSAGCSSTPARRGHARARRARQPVAVRPGARRARRASRRARRSSRSGTG